MADSSLMIGLFSLAGTALGFTGGLVTSLVVERQKQAYEKAKEARRKKEDKLEQLASALYAQEHWLIQVVNEVAAGEDRLEALLAKLSPPPFSTILAISILYFPEFEDQIKQLSKRSAEYVNFLLHDKRQNIDVSKTLFLQYLDLVKRLEDMMREYAKHEFQ